MKKRYFWKPHRIILWLSSSNSLGVKTSRRRHQHLSFHTSGWQTLHLPLAPRSDATFCAGFLIIHWFKLYIWLSIQNHRLEKKTSIRHTFSRKYQAPTWFFEISGRVKWCSWCEKWWKWMILEQGLRTPETNWHLLATNQISMKPVRFHMLLSIIAIIDCFSRSSPFFAK